jgi:hypothetical protein
VLDPGGIAWTEQSGPLPSVRWIMTPFLALCACALGQAPEEKEKDLVYLNSERVLVSQAMQGVAKYTAVANKTTDPKLNPTEPGDMFLLSANVPVGAKLTVGVYAYARTMRPKKPRPWTPGDFEFGQTLDNIEATPIANQHGYKSGKWGTVGHWARLENTGRAPELQKVSLFVPYSAFQLKQGIYSIVYSVRTYMHDQQGRAVVHDDFRLGGDSFVESTVKVKELLVVSYTEIDPTGGIHPMRTVSLLGAKPKNGF